MTLRCFTVATLAASLLAALYVGLWMAARRPTPRADRPDVARFRVRAAATRRMPAIAAYEALVEDMLAALSEPDPYATTGI